jgi:hypothetical protein
MASIAARKRTFACFNGASHAIAVSRNELQWTVNSVL